MRKKYDIELFNEIMIEAYENQELNTDFAKHFFESYLSGERSFYQKHIKETKKYEDSWIKDIESYLPSLMRITKNMKSQLKYEEEIIPIEKTKRVNSDSIRYLSTNTKYLKEVDEDEYLPEKILTNIGEIEYGIYENRFIMTLIARLRDYTYERLKVLKMGIFDRRKIHLNTTSDFVFANDEYTIKLDIEKVEYLKDPTHDSHNENIYEQAQRLYKYIASLMNSPFYKQLKRFKKVKPPIIKTQIMLKNADFKKAYLLWLYLDQHTEMGFNYEAQSLDKSLTELYQMNLARISMGMVGTVLAHDNVDEESSYTYNEYKRTIESKILLKLPDEPLLEDMEDDDLLSNFDNDKYLNDIKNSLEDNLIDINESYTPNHNPIISNALSKSINLQNKLYDDYLKLNSEDFSLIKNVEDRIKKIKEKQELAALIAKMKQDDLKNTLALEQEWNKELHKAYSELMDLENSNYKEETNRLTATEKLALTKEMDALISREKLSFLAEYSKEKEEIERLKEKLNKDYINLKNKLKAKQEKEILKSKEKIKNEILKEKIKQHDQLKKENAKKLSDIKSKKESMLKEHQDKFSDLNNQFKK